MFCTNCGSALPENGAKFCPNCGTRLLQAEPLTPPLEDTPEVPAEEILDPITPLENTFESSAEESPEAPQKAESVESEAVPAPEQEPVPETTSPAFEAPASSAGSVLHDLPTTEPVRKLHFTATLAIVFTAISCAFFFLTLLGLILTLHPAVMIIASICLLLNTPFAFGFGVAAFIVGLRKKHPATWIIGLVAALLAVFSFFLGVFALVGSVIYAAG